MAAERVAATFVATLAGIFPFPDILRSDAKSGPVRSQQLLLKRRLFNFRLSLPMFLFSQFVLRFALNELDFQLWPPTPITRSLTNSRIKVDEKSIGE